MWNPNCPECNNPLVPYISGYPSDDLIALDREKMIKWTGTCIWNPDMPKSHCYACETDFDIPSVLEY